MVRKPQTAAVGFKIPRDRIPALDAAAKKRGFVNRSKLFEAMLRFFCPEVFSEEQQHEQPTEATPTKQ